VKMAYRCLKYKELMALANKTTNGYAKNMLWKKQQWARRLNVLLWITKFIAVMHYSYSQVPLHPQMKFQNL
jgi:hypothetical protein